MYYEFVFEITYFMDKNYQPEKFTEFLQKCFKNKIQDRVDID